MKSFLKKCRRAAKGAISILLSIVLVSVFSLGSLVMESGRYQSAKAQLDEANLSAAISMLSNFNETLSETYGLFAFSDEDIKEESYYDYLNFNSDLDSEYYGDNISRLYGTPTAEIDTMYNLTNTAVLKRQLMEYSKYNIPLNTAAEALDVEEMMKELKENVAKALPGLDKMLDICNAVAKMAEALEKIYQLEKKISEIDRCYGGSSLLDEALLEVDGFFTQQEVASYDPDYKKAYDQFEEAVNNKVEYMKKHKAPANPGENPPYSQTTVNSYESAMKTAKKNLTNKVINILVKEYEKSTVFGGKTTIDIQGDSATCVEIMSSIISGFNSEATEQEQLRTIIKYIAQENYNYEIKNWNAETLKSLKAKLASEPDNSLNSLNTAYASAKSTYDTAVSKNNTWKEKKKEYDEYQEKIKSYNEAITSKASTYKQRCTDLKTLLAAYKGLLDSASGNLAKVESSLNEINGEKKENSEAFKKLQGILDGALDQLTNTCITYLDEDAVKAGQIIDNPNEIDSKYSFGSNFKKHNVQNYYLSNAQAVTFVSTLQTIKAIDESLIKVTKLIEAFKNLCDLFSAVPYISDPDCNVTLSKATVDLLPTTTGTVSDDTGYPSDISELSTILNDAKTVLNAEFNSDINKVDPNSRLQEADVVDEISARLDSTIEAIKFLSSSGAVLGSGAFLFALVFQLQEYITHIRTLVDNFKYFISNIGTTIEVIMQSLYENTLLNSYILEKFPNRVDREDKSYKGYDGLVGVIPTGEVTTFKAACVEYVLTGKTSEILNQNDVFWKIFLVRMLNNIVCVATNAEVMELIASCNVFALIVFPLWVYFETNFDMNVLLMGDGGKVPLIKTKLILSPTGLTEMGEHLVRIVEDLENADDDELDKVFEGLTNRMGLITDELLEGHGLFPFSYDNYLWLMLFLTSNNTKVMRIADLIQMDMRYQELYGSKGKGTATFLMSESNTFIRVKCTATFNSVLPIIAMNKGNINDYGIKMTSVKYVGY